MKIPSFGGLVLFSASLMASAAAEGAEPIAPTTEKNYIFASFRGNGEDGLHLAYSHDGLKWTPLNNDKSYLKPRLGGNLMRDPCICRGPDGMWHLAWTTGWWDKGIGIAHSKDLIHWSEQQFVPAMQTEPKALNCWAPEIFYDEQSGKFLIFWATTIPGRFPETDSTGDDHKGGKLNHRIYYVTTKDFKTYSDAKLLYDDGFSVIDATLVKDGDKYVLIFKDETKLPVAKKNIRLATADAAAGPYGHASAPISPDWVEGPTAVKIGERWIVYFDEYTRGRYGAIASADMKQWENISEKLSFPKGTRHGTAFAVPQSVLQNLQK
ncbi:MAG: glycoside hydrolase family 43 protein [Thermoguttaceae bacterium]